VKTTLQRVLAVVALLAIAVWLGGLVALGAIAAPVVFSLVPYPSSADAMTVVFRRFDAIAMVCAAIVLISEAAGRLARVSLGRLDQARAFLALVAAAAAVFEGASVSPRIAALHAAGAIRGVGDAGIELAHLHDLAETCGKTELVLLSALIVLHVVALSGRKKA
jgi:putative copper export protein